MFSSGTITSKTSIEVIDHCLPRPLFLACTLKLTSLFSVLGTEFGRVGRRFMVLLDLVISRSDHPRESARHVRWVAPTVCQLGFRGVRAHTTRRKYPPGAASSPRSKLGRLRMEKSYRVQQFGVFRLCGRKNRERQQEAEKTRRKRTTQVRES